MSANKRESDKIVSRIKNQKRATIAGLIIIVALSVFLFGGFHYFNGIEEKGIGLSLHPLIVLFIIILESVCAVIIYSRIENKTERFLDERCDPGLYRDIKRAISSRGSYIRSMQITDLVVSYYLGDYAICSKFAEEAIHASGDHDKLFAYSYLGMSSFLLNDTRSLERSVKNFQKIFEKLSLSNRSPVRADLDRRLTLLNMMNAAVRNDPDNAVRITDSLSELPERTTAIETLNTVFLRGVVYDLCSNKKKAEECYSRCREIPNKTFIYNAVNNDPPVFLKLQ